MISAVEFIIFNWPLTAKHNFWHEGLAFFQILVEKTSRRRAVFVTFFDTNGDWQFASEAASSKCAEEKEKIVMEGEIQKQNVSPQRMHDRLI